MGTVFENNLLSSFVISIICYILYRVVSYFITKIGKTKNILPKRVFYVVKFFQFIVFIILLMALSIIWNIQFGGIMIFASSIFAVIGVALFAQWSILSNLTASIIIFFTFPARVGDKIKIVDGDNSVIGEIKEISLFQIEIIDEEHNIVLYPNNLFIQKPIIKMKKEKVVRESI